MALDLIFLENIDIWTIKWRHSRRCNKMIDNGQMIGIIHKFYIEINFQNLVFMRKIIMKSKRQ